MYHVDAQGVDERMINIQYYYHDDDDDDNDDDDDDDDDDDYDDDDDDDDDDYRGRYYYHDYDDDNEDDDDDDAYRGRLCDFLCPTSLRLYSPWIFLISFSFLFLSKVLSSDRARN